MRGANRSYKLSYRQKVPPYNEADALQWQQDFRFFVRQEAPLSYQILTGQLKSPFGASASPGSADDSAMFRQKTWETYSLTTMKFEDSSSDEDEISFTAGTRMTMEDAIARQLFGDEQPSAHRADTERAPAPATERMGGLEQQDVDQQSTQTAQPDVAAVVEETKTGVETPHPQEAGTEGPPPADDDIAQPATTTTRHQQQATDAMGARERAAATARKIASTIAGLDLRTRRRRSSRKRSAKSNEKMLETILRNTIHPDLWQAMPSDIRETCYVRANDTLYVFIRNALTIGQRYLISSCTPGDGYACWVTMVELQVERTGKAETYWLNKIMACKISHCRRSGGYSIRAFIEQLTQYNDCLATSRGGQGCSPAILRAKILDLPDLYNPIVSRLQIEEQLRKDEGQQVRPIARIIEIIATWEKQQRPGRRALVERSHGSTRNSRYTTNRSQRQQRIRDTKSRYRNPRSGRAMVAKANENPSGNPSNKNGERGKRPFPGECWNCGQTGHRAIDCPHPRKNKPPYVAKLAEELAAMYVKAKPRQGRQPPKRGKPRRNNAQRAPRGKKQMDKGNNRRRSPMTKHLGFLLRDVTHEELMLAREEARMQRTLSGSKPIRARRNTFLLDSGCTSHFCVPGTLLKNTRPTERVIRGAGTELLSSTLMGDIGPLLDASIVDSLDTSLCSVPTLIKHYDFCVLFTGEGAYAIPAPKAAQLSKTHVQFGTKNDAGLYDTNLELVQRAIANTRHTYQDAKHANAEEIVDSMEESTVDSNKGGPKWFAKWADAHQPDKAAQELADSILDIANMANELLWAKHQKKGMDERTVRVLRTYTAALQGNAKRLQHLAIQLSLKSRTSKSEGAKGHNSEQKTSTGLANKATITPQTPTNQNPKPKIKSKMEQTAKPPHKKQLLPPADSSYWRHRGQTPPKNGQFMTPDEWRSKLKERNDTRSTSKRSPPHKLPKQQAAMTAQNVNALTSLDLCSGIGGFTQSCLQAGFTPLGTVDICLSMAEFHHKNFPGVPHHTVDILEHSTQQMLIERYRPLAPTLITCSPPCQPFSRAGLRKPNDPRIQVLTACIRTAVAIKPQAIICENTSLMPTCPWAPVWRQEAQPLLEQAGYNVVIVKNDASQCGIPQRRIRVWCCATLHDCSEALTKQMDMLSQQRRMPLSDWFEDVRLYRTVPCHNGQSVYHARDGPHPTLRTVSILDMPMEMCQEHPADAGHYTEAVTLTLEQKLALCGMPPTFQWPHIDHYCQHPCCGNKRTIFPLVSVAAGNIVCPAQCLTVLRGLDLNKDDHEESHLQHRALAYRDSIIQDPVTRLHVRLGHAGVNRMLACYESRYTLGIPGLTSQRIKDWGKTYWCKTCCRSKASPGPHKSELPDRQRAEAPNMLIHTDSMTRTYPSLEGNLYIQVYTDDYHRWRHVEFFPRRDFATFSATFDRAIAQLTLLHRESAEAQDKAMDEGRTPRCFLSDAAGEVIKQRERLANKGIGLKIVGSASKTSNSIAERANLAILTMARGLLSWAELPVSFFESAMQHAVRISNCLPTRSNPDKRSPYHMHYGKPPDITRLRNYGCVAWTYSPKESRQSRSKLDDTSTPMLFVGYPPTTVCRDSVLVWNPKTGRTMQRHYKHVILQEDTPGGYLAKASPHVRRHSKLHGYSLHRQPQVDTPRQGGALSPNIEIDLSPYSGDDEESKSEDVELETKEPDTWNINYQTSPDETLRIVAQRFSIDLQELTLHNEGIEGADPSTGLLDPDQELITGTGLWLPDGTDMTQPSLDDIGAALDPEFLEDSASEEEEDSDSDDTANAPAYRTRSRAARDHQANDEHAMIATALTDRYARDLTCPKNYKEAIKSEQADEWRKAMAIEWQGLTNRGVYEWVEPDRTGKIRPIDSTWAYRIKQLADGRVAKCKARLCCRGFRQRPGIDFTETTSPVTILSAWRACIAMAARPGWYVALIDFAQAFLAVDLDGPEVRMYAPEGITPPRPGQQLSLRKALYGLRQSSRKFWQLVTKEFGLMGLKPSTADPSLFIYQPKSGRPWQEGDDAPCLRINVHVDDCCVTYNSPALYQAFRKTLQERFDLSESDQSNVFLGILINRLPGPENAISLSQQPYIIEVLQQHNLMDAKPTRSPFPSGLKLTKEQRPQTEEEKEAMKDIPFRTLCGQLLYLAGATRPDIQFAVHQCARHSSNPGQAHWKALLHIAKYLKGTINLTLTYGKKYADTPHVPLVGWVDSSWGDTDDRHSTTGFVFVSRSGPISWRSTKQKCIALSSTEAEYIASSEMAKESTWLARLFLNDLGFSKTGLGFDTGTHLTEQQHQGKRPMVVYCDSTGAIALSKNPISRRATKHIELRWHYVRQCVEAGQLRLVHERTDRNRADAYTKGLPTTTFIKHRDTMLRPYVKPVNPTCYDPDELEQTRLQQAHLCYKMNNYHVSKHAESLFVPRPDGQHKGSNESDLHSRLILYRALQRHRAQLIMDLARMNAAEHRLLSPAQFSTEQELFKINKVSDMLENELTRSNHPNIDFCQSNQTRHSESLLVVRPDTQHKGSNDSMAEEAHQDAPMPARLPYGAAGPDYQGPEPETLWCVHCDKACPAEFVPSGLYALMPHDGDSGLTPESDLLIRNNFNFDPVPPKEWTLDTTLEDLISRVRGHLEDGLSDDTHDSAQALTHLGMIEQIINTINVEDITIRDMFDREQSCMDSDISWSNLVDHHKPNCPWATQCARRAFEMQTRKEIAEQLSRKRKRSSEG